MKKLMIICALLIGAGCGTKVDAGAPGPLPPNPEPPKVCDSDYKTWKRAGLEFFRLKTPDLRCAGVVGAKRILCMWRFSTETFPVELGAKQSDEDMDRVLETLIKPEDELTQ